MKIYIYQYNSDIYRLCLYKNTYGSETRIYIDTVHDLNDFQISSYKKVILSEITIKNFLCNLLKININNEVKKYFEKCIKLNMVYG